MGTPQALRTHRFLCVALCTLVFSLAAQSEPVWVARYSSSSNSQDFAENIVLGRDGSVYVSGFSYEEGPANAAIVKYSGGGQQLWAVQNTNISRVNLTGPLPLTALDLGDGVRLAGDWTGATNEVAVVGYSSGGTLLWERHFREGFESHPHAIVVDGSSNTIVVGWSKSSSTADALILKYAPDGTLLWNRTYSLLPVSTEYAYSAAPLPDDSVLVGLRCDSRGTMVLKYSGSGQLLWVAELGTQSIPGAIKIDFSGAIVVAGMGYFAPEALFKLNQEGQLLWRRWPLTVSVNHMALDSSGNIYVAGDGLRTAKYDASGTELWTSRFAEADSFVSGPAGIVADDSGVSIGLAIYHLQTNRFAAVHYTADGVEIWRDSYWETGGQVQGMVGDATGGVHLAGVGGSDFQTLKFQPVISAMLPTIIGAPQHLEVVEGTNSAVFSVLTGPGEHTFQWRRDGEAIPDATNATLQLTGINEIQHSGHYSVVVSNAHGHIVSPEARLFLRRPPRIDGWTIGATNVIMIAGDDLALRNGASGDEPMTFEWRKDGALLPSTNSMLLIERVTPADAGTYTRIARNPYGVTTNHPVSVTVAPRTAIDEWRWSRPRPQGNTLSAVAFGNGKFVAVGDAGALLTSTDGTTWAVTNVSRFDLAGVSFGNGTFVAVARTGSIYTSTDAQSWTLREPPITDSSWHAGVSFLNGMFITYGQQILTSANGLVWTNHGFSPVISRPIAFGGGRYLMPGYGYNMISTNLNDWKAYILGNDFYELVSAAYGNGVFVINNWGELFTLIDGAGVTNRHPVPYTVNVAFVNGRFFAVGQTIETSQDGVNWTRVAEGFHQSLWSITYGNGVYVAVGSRGVIATSTDGQMWTRTPRGIADVRGIAHGNGRYVAVGDEEAWISTDGEVWSSITGPVAEDPTGITWANGTFVVVGRDGELLTSRDGTTWARVALVTNDLRAVIHDGTRFVVAGEQTTLFSTNGVQWTRIESPESREVRALAFGGGLYVMSRYGFQGMLISTNAVDWEPVLESLSVNEFAYGNGRFVGLMFDGATVSTDGILWNRGEISPLFVVFGSVAFGDGMFVALGAHEGTIATSTNGQDWILHHTRAPVSWTRVSYANGAFWLLGDDESLMRSAQMEPALRARKAGTGIELTVQAYPGQSYRLQRATALGAWSDFQTFTPQSETTTLIDNNAGSTSAFYRIVSP
jgi:hypothetical protein